MCIDVVFFKQKTAYEMRISDWISDVCSSDLGESRQLCHPGQGGRFCRAHIGQLYRRDGITPFRNAPTDAASGVDCIDAFHALIQPPRGLMPKDRKSVV